MESLIQELKKTSIGEFVLLVGLSSLLFICPLYFGTNFGQNSVDLVPLNIIVWFSSANWPLSIASIFAGALLALALVLYPNRLRSERLSIAQISPWGLLLLALIPSAFVTTEKYFLLQFISHLLLALSVGLSVWMVVNHRPQFRPLLIGAILCGGLRSVYNGFYQYFVKFGETLDYIEANPDTVNSALLGRAKQTLLFADFVISNSYAAHLILITGVCAYFMYAQFKKRYDSHKQVLILSAVGTVPFLVCLALTKSRAGISAAMFTLALMLCLRLKGRQRLISSITVCLTGLLLLYVFRTVPSLVIRLEYLRVGWEMLCAKPWGMGMGEYRNAYLLYKTPGFEGVVLPHSVSVAIISQCGIPGLLACLLILYSFIKMGKIYLHTSKPFNFFIYGGVLAWLIHAQADFNFFIPGTVMTVGALLALLEHPKAEEQKNLPKNLTLVVNLFMFAVACTAFYQVKELYSQYRFSVLHDKFFGSGLIDYRFVNKQSYSLDNCQYCFEPVLEDGDGFCIHCGVLGDPLLYTASEIMDDATALVGLMSARADLWKMTHQKLMTMYFSGKAKIDSGVKLDLVQNTQYLVEAERALENLLLIESNFGRNYVELALVKIHLKKSYKDISNLVNRAVELSPDLRQAHDLRIYLYRQYGKLYPDDEDLFMQGLSSQVSMLIIRLAPLRMKLRTQVDPTNQEIAMLQSVEKNYQVLSNFTRGLKNKQSLSLQLEALERIINELKEGKK